MSSNPVDHSAPEQPRTVKAPTRQDAGGPTAVPNPGAGGTYSQGSKSGGEAGIQPSGPINARNLAKPAVIFELDGEQVEARPGEPIGAVAKPLGNPIPPLCHKPEPGYRPDGNCRACMV